MFSIEEIVAMNDRAVEEKEAEDLAAKEKTFDLTASIMAFEDGEIDEDGLIELFQYLVNTGLAWRLQGFYGRTAVSLIEAGLIDPGHGQNVEAN